MSPDALRDLVALRDRATFLEDEASFWLFVKALGFGLLAVPVALLVLAVKAWWEKRRRPS